MWFRGDFVRNKEKLDAGDFKGSKGRAGKEYCRQPTISFDMNLSETVPDTVFSYGIGAWDRVRASGNVNAYSLSLCSSLNFSDFFSAGMTRWSWNKKGKKVSKWWKIIWYLTMKHFAIEKYFVVRQSFDLCEFKWSLCNIINCFMNYKLKLVLENGTYRMSLSPLGYWILFNLLNIPWLT